MRGRRGPPERSAEPAPSSRMRAGPTTVTPSARCIEVILEIRLRTNERAARRPAESERNRTLPHQFGCARSAILLSSVSRTRSAANAASTTARFASPI